VRDGKQGAQVDTCVSVSKWWVDTHYKCAPVEKAGAPVEDRIDGTTVNQQARRGNASFLYT